MYYGTLFRSIPENDFGNRHAKRFAVHEMKLKLKKRVASKWSGKPAGV